MKCAVHTDVDATGFCRNCGKALCAQCAREVRGALYCEECLSHMVAGPSPVVPGVSAGPNPAAACALGLVPGLGAVYNGEYVKGLIHVIIFGGLIALMNSDSISSGMQAMIVVFFIAFCCYMPIEAYRTARARQLGQPVPGIFGEGESQRPIGAFVLIGLGILFLLDTMGVLDSLWIGRLWPLVLIAIGVLLIWKRTQVPS
ncbi:MAG: B-box zinc finger protein [Candidatus Acidiferrales bacterium]